MSLFPRLLLVSPLLTAAAAACGPVQIADEPTLDGGAHDAAPTLEAGSGSGGGDSAFVSTDSGTSDSSLSCVGPAPNCFGSDDQLCCGKDPAGPAVCQNGQWMCGAAAAPGCNGTSCTQPMDSGSDAPLCSHTAFGIDPGGVQLQPGGTRTFTAFGGTGAGNVWSLDTNRSGGSVDPTTGAYKAGATTDVTDVVKVTDSQGCWVTASVLVGHVNEVMGSSSGQPNFPCGSNVGPYCASAQTYCFFVAQGADGDLGYICKPLNGCADCACLTAGFNGVCENAGGDLTLAGFAEKAGPYP